MCWSKMIKGSIWKCIDKGSKHFNQRCEIKEIENDPDCNGDGEILLLYSNGIKHHGKVRRFIPGLTHKFIRKGE